MEKCKTSVNNIVPIKEYLYAIFIAWKNQYYKIAYSYQIKPQSHCHLDYTPKAFLLKLLIWIEMYIKMQIQEYGPRIS